MKNLSKFLCICMCLVVLGGCASGDSETVATDTPAPATDTPVPQIETITIYTIDPTSMQLIPSRIKTDENGENISAICDMVISNLDDDDIKITDALLDGDTGIVVFDTTGKPLTGCDEEMETLILECFANSILENVDGCQNIIFRSDKGAYSSEHMEFGEDEVYASN